MEGWCLTRECSSVAAVFGKAKAWFVEQELEDCTTYIQVPERTLHPVAVFSVFLECVEILHVQQTLLAHLGRNDEFHTAALEFVRKVLTQTQQLPVEKWLASLPSVVLDTAVAISMVRCARVDWKVSDKELGYWSANLHQDKKSVAMGLL